MVMDEAGRNGRKWHLAQQITQLVIKPHIMQLSITIFKQQFTQHVIALSHRYGGDFYFFYKYQKNSPSYPIIIIYNLLTNRWLKYGIIRWC